MAIFHMGDPGLGVKENLSSTFSTAMFFGPLMLKEVVSPIERGLTSGILAGYAASVCDTMILFASSLMPAAVGAVAYYLAMPAICFPWHQRLW